MSNFETIIGIEIHLELNTKTKIFSSAPIDFGAKPNSKVVNTDLGYPGTLPILNKQVVVKGIQLAKALNMKIDDHLHFDRKNYLYPDLPKGFQITQDKRPIGSKGEIPIYIDGKKKIIEIERIHLEEDTAKSIHKNGKTFLDYNRSGNPLIEIVTRPVIKNKEQARAYISAIRNLALALDISDAKLEEGSLRADVNISIRPYGAKINGKKVEIKNLNSLSNVEKSIDQEIETQVKRILSGKEILQATKRFDEATQKLKTMRIKKNAIDYRYFPEPNIPIIKLEKSFIDGVKINELPWEARKRLREMKIDNEFAEQLLADQDKLNFFDKIQYPDKKHLVTFFFSQIVSSANKLNKEVSDLNILPSEVKILLEKQDQGLISGSHVKKIFPKLIDQKMTVDQVIKQEKIAMISDAKILEQMINDIIKVSADFIEKNIERVERVEKFILGQVMKASKGQANPVLTSKILKDKLGV